MNWTGAQQAYCVHCSAIPQNRIHHIHAARFSIALQYSMEKSLYLCVLQFWDVFQASRTLDKLSNSISTPVLISLLGNRPLWRNSNLLCKIRTTLLLKLLETYFSRNPVVASELECIVSFLFYQCLKSVIDSRNPSSELFLVDNIELFYVT